MLVRKQGCMRISVNAWMRILENMGYKVYGIRVNVDQDIRRDEML